MKNSTQMRKGYYKENKGLEKFIYALAIKFQNGWWKCHSDLKQKASLAGFFYPYLEQKTYLFKPLKDARVGQEISPLNIS